MKKIMLICVIVISIFLIGCSNLGLGKDIQITKSINKNCFKYNKYVTDPRGSSYGQDKELVRTEECMKINFKITNKGSKSIEVSFPAEMIFVSQKVEVDSYDFIDWGKFHDQRGEDYDNIDLNCYTIIGGGFETIYPTKSASRNYCFPMDIFEEYLEATIYYNYQGSERSLKISEIPEK